MISLLHKCSSFPVLSLHKGAFLNTPVSHQQPFPEKLASLNGNSYSPETHHLWGCFWTGRWHKVILFLNEVPISHPIISAGFYTQVDVTVNPKVKVSPRLSPDNVI